MVFNEVTKGEARANCLDETSTNSNYPGEEIKTAYSLK
jgi:hypothetical protein